MNRDDKPKIFINNWKLLAYGYSAYTAPEQRVTVLVGEAPSHPTARAQGHTFIQTGEVLWFSHSSGIAETKNTIYTLGEPCKDWMAWLNERGYALDHYSIEKI